MGLVSEAENAARLTVGQPLTFESLGEGLRSFNGQSMCELIRYRGVNNSSRSSSQLPPSPSEEWAIPAVIPRRVRNRRR